MILKIDRHPSNETSGKSGLDFNFSYIPGLLAVLGNAYELALLKYPYHFDSSQ
jgi:hypothetical protein